MNEKIESLASENLTRIKELQSKIDELEGRLQKLENQRSES